MNSLLATAVVVFLGLGLIHWRWRGIINPWLSTGGKWITTGFNWIIAALLDPNFFKIVVDFCAEAAVLIAVFPILDRMFDPTSHGRVTWQLVLGSEGLAAFFMMIAAVLSTVAGRNK